MSETAPSATTECAPGYELSFDPARVDVELVWKTLAGLYWSPGVRREVVEKALANSIVVGAYSADGAQVGYTRAVTDRATFAWVCDVFVLEGHRGKGLARSMVQKVHTHPDLQTLRRWLLATADAHAIYETCGYRPLAKPDRWMELPNPVQVWQDPRFVDPQG
ncbi:MAG: GNAT family N-acetyltransferase [Phycisphaerales bacterium]|nr:GNAT family N-acetyltransferase [Phycisphaerales bacterium]MCB9835095.1 GNAT family N-acetyltransferase [Phycisphaera sp.]